jgi:hypothetical protein
VAREAAKAVRMNREAESTHLSLARLQQRQIAEARHRRALEVTAER